MYIKTIKKVSGIPTATVAVSPGKTDAGTAQVTAFLSSHAGVDNDVVASLRLSPAEARDLAARLVASADAADAMVKVHLADVCQMHPKDGCHELMRGERRCVYCGREIA